MAVKGLTAEEMSPPFYHTISAEIWTASLSAILRQMSRFGPVLINHGL